MTLENAKKKLPRVALIASERTVTEYRMFLGHLLVGLTDNSIPVVLVCPQQSDVSSIVLGAAEVIRYSPFELPLIAYLNKKVLVERLAKFKPNVLHCLCETQVTHVHQLARQLDMPYLLTVNSLQERWSRLAISSKQCARIVVPAQSIAANVAKVNPRLADRVRKINIGTFTTQTAFCFSEPARITTIVTAHPFRNTDEFENLFSALRHLRIDGYEFMIVVIGGGRAERQLWKLLAALGLSQIVTIVPRATLWRLVLGAGDIFIRPQPTTAFDPFLLEAMSVGSAVAGCKGGVDDLIIEDETAVVFSPNEDLSIMQTLQRLLSRREFARKIAKNAQEHLKKNHSVSNMISKTLQVYHEAQW